jgi:AcrR family transcriptional regulator
MARVSVDERRRQLIDAAISLLTREGVGAASTRRISEEAGVPLGLVHYCFGSKRELIAETIRFLNTENVDAVRAAIQVGSGGRDVGDVLRAGFRAYWLTVELAPERHLITYELNSYALRDPELVPVAADRHRDLLAAVRELLDGVAADAGLRWTVPVDDVAQLVLSVLSGLTLSWLNDRDSAAARSAAELFVQQFGALMA